jgi:NAD(P)-dependent dehydrogenase (short-subunit alcohol dehydrogenase family)
LSLDRNTDLAGRRVLVTGAGRGIGAAVARRLAELGAAVVALARTRAEVERVAAALPGSGHAALALDVADEAAWQETAETGALAGVDGLVTAAAVLAPVGPLGSYTPAEFWATMRVNVLGTLLAVHHCRVSLETSGGAVVAFAGGGATSPQPRYDAYATSKAAVVRLVENLAVELAGRGVRVNAVSPGFVATGIHAATLAAGPERAGVGYFASTERQLDAGGVPAARAAALTAFLLGEGAAGITGKVLSAPWDPWDEPAFQWRLRGESDLATVRRIDDQLFAPVRSAAMGERS